MDARRRVVVVGRGELRAEADDAAYLKAKLDVGGEAGAEEFLRLSLIVAYDVEVGRGGELTASEQRGRALDAVVHDARKIFRVPDFVLVHQAGRDAGGKAGVADGVVPDAASEEGAAFQAPVLAVLKLREDLGRPPSVVPQGAAQVEVAVVDEFVVDGNEVDAREHQVGVRFAEVYERSPVVELNGLLVLLGSREAEGEVAGPASGCICIHAEAFNVEHLRVSRGSRQQQENRNQKKKDSSGFDGQV